MVLLKVLLMIALSVNDAYAATAIATCESGDTENFGTYDWSARSATSDGGAFQFNDATWKWLVGEGRGDTASPLQQAVTFRRLYDGGAGLQHWSASAHCWSRWIDTHGKPVNQAHFNAFVRKYTSTVQEGAH